ncbi:MAG: STAS/SEC14 domain-containing protein [Flavobacteriales bacterium]|nr:STAS/SEC14 domain-containing protein [Flavobacteriales bacterium]
MARVGSSIETESATITKVSADRLEQRFKSGALFEPELLERNRAAREELSRGRPYSLTIVLPEGVDVQPQSMNLDHFRPESNERRINALAVVTNCEDINAVSKFYFRYYAYAFEVKVFDDEDDACAWLDAQTNAKVL